MFHFSESKPFSMTIIVHLILEQMTLMSCLFLVNQKQFECCNPANSWTNDSYEQVLFNESKLYSTNSVV